MRTKTHQRLQQVFSKQHKPNYGYESMKLVITWERLDMVLSNKHLSCIAVREELEDLHKLPKWVKLLQRIASSDKHMQMNA